MNENIMKGKCLEIKGRVKEVWGKLTFNDLLAIEGKGERLLGILRKKYGYIIDKADLEYKDSVEMAEIVGNIREIMTKKKDFMPVAFITRYWQPLLADKQESPITGKDENHGYGTDRYFSSRLNRRTSHLASQ